MSRERVASAGLRVVLAGATGALGREVLAELEQASVPVAELIPVATERSIGTEMEFRDVPLSVESELPSLASVDLLILCTPAAVAREMIREALRAQVACIDCSGSAAGLQVALDHTCGVVSVFGVLHGEAKLTTRHWLQSISIVTFLPMTDEDTRFVLRLWEEGKLDTDILIGARLSFERYAEAVELLMEKKVLKVCLYPN